MMMIDTADTTDDHFTIGTNVCVCLSYVRCCCCCFSCFFCESAPEALLFLTSGGPIVAAAFFG